MIQKNYADQSSPDKYEELDADILGQSKNNKN
jgi:hypothetical protein